MMSSMVLATLDKPDHMPKQEALQKEWNRLRARNTWDDETVVEESKMRAQCQAAGTEAHFARLFAMCVEKNSELPEGDPARTYKGRVVFER